jgi:hypothetical protein
MRITAIVVSTTLTALALLPALALAEKNEVAIEVISISASTETVPAAGRAALRQEKAESKPVVDAELSRFSKKLRSLFAYTRYSFLSRGRSEAEFGGMSTFRLPEQFLLEVEPERFEKDEERIEMMVTLVHEVPPKPGDDADPVREIVLRTKIKLGNGGTVLLGGPPIDGGVLILALSARG